MALCNNFGPTFLILLLLRSPCNCLVFGFTLKHNLQAPLSRPTSTPSSIRFPSSRKVSKLLNPLTSPAHKTISNMASNITDEAIAELIEMQNQLRISTLSDDMASNSTDEAITELIAMQKQLRISTLSIEAKQTNVADVATDGEDLPMDQELAKNSTYCLLKFCLAQLRHLICILETQSDAKTSATEKIAKFSSTQNKPEWFVEIDNANTARENHKKCEQMAEVAVNEMDDLMEYLRRSLKSGEDALIMLPQIPRIAAFY
ncbi:hypothetical protein V491_07755 [Pseudogymnoascus sp. VKM F-3775]|nr:hypothetical protein V491_07755 [Pseudogymnoascus sp. VKM F-3775]